MGHMIQTRYELKKGEFNSHKMIEFVQIFGNKETKIISCGIKKWNELKKHIKEIDDYFNGSEKPEFEQSVAQANLNQEEENDERYASEYIPF